MSRKKANSMSNVPFSWEKMPGVPKFMTSLRCTRGLIDNNREVQKKVLPLPPGSFREAVRSSSKRMSWTEEDPFLAALIECSKDCDKYKAKGEVRKSFGSRVWMSKSFLSSCKHSFDVQEGNLVMSPSSFGQERVQGLMQMQEEIKK